MKTIWFLIGILICLFMAYGVYDFTAPLVQPGDTLRADAPMTAYYAPGGPDLGLRQLVGFSSCTATYNIAKGEIVEVWPDQSNNNFYYWLGWVRVRRTTDPEWFWVFYPFSSLKLYPAKGG